VSDHPPNANQGKSRSTPPLIRISLVLPRLDGGVECSALSARRRTPASRRMRSLMASGSRPDPLPRKSKLAPALLWVKGFRVEIVRPATSLLSLKLGPRSRGHPPLFYTARSTVAPHGAPAPGDVSTPGWWSNRAPSYYHPTRPEVNRTPQNARLRSELPGWIEWLSVINVTQEIVDEFFTSIGADFNRSRREHASRSNAVGDPTWLADGLQWGCEEAGDNERHRAIATSC